MAEHRTDLGELERLFAAGRLSRSQFVRAVAALGLAAGGLESLLGSSAIPARAAPARAKYLVLIVLDAFRPDYEDLTPMPHLRALAQRGTSYDRAWVAQLESETPTGHATISTGSMPRNDGIIGFEWRSPITRKEVGDGWPAGVLSGAMERDIRASGATSIPQAIKAADRRAIVVTLSSEKVYAADAMGGWAADYILYHRWTKARLVPDAVPGHVPPAEFFHHADLTMKLPRRHFSDWDYLSSALALAAVADFKPRALMVNLPGADVYGHPYGGPANPRVMGLVAAGLDRNLGRIIDAYRRAGIEDETLFVVTADHGMVQNDRTVDGSVTKAVTQHAGGEYLFHTGGTAADIYLNNPRRAAPLVAKAMARVPNVAAAYYQTVVDGNFGYERAASDSIDPTLDAAYQYLLRTFAGPTAPDVVAPFQENTIGSKFNHARGDHGGLNWGAQHVPLIIAGPGVKAGIVSHFPARLVDVAPTVLQLLGLPKSNMDGTILADAIESSTGAEVSNQEQLRDLLTGYQDALMAQATFDVARDQKDGVHPPPALPMRP